MAEWRKLVGANVKRLRQQRGLSQEKLAGDAALDISYVGGIERGIRNPSLDVIVRIAGALSVEPADLLTR